jgi:hypothetical protein
MQTRPRMHANEETRKFDVAAMKEIIERERKAKE